MRIIDSITSDIFVKMASTSALNAIKSDFLRRLSSQKLNSIHKLFFCSEEICVNSSEKKSSGFAKAFAKQAEIIHSPQVEEESFAALLRKSKFIDLGDPVGKVVVGTIYRVVGNDLYIDFGWKFPTVCTRPKDNARLYLCGTKVKILIKNLELSTKFLGSDSEVTLNEADCTLIGLLKKN